jgi:hypothetical protein
VKKIDAIAMRLLGGLVVVQPLGTIALVALAPSIRWEHVGLLIASGLSAVVGYGLLTLQPWVMSLYVYWIVASFVGGYCALRVADWSVLEATLGAPLMAFLPVVFHGLARRIFESSTRSEETDG